MPQPLTEALDAVRALVLDRDRLVRAVAAGRRRGTTPALVRAELRPVDLAAGPHLQVVTTAAGEGPVPPAPVTRNLDEGAAPSAVDALLAEPFGNWHVETVDEVVQVRVTKRGEAQVHRSRTASRQVAPRVAPRAHDRVKSRLIDPDDPVLAGADADKRRQVDAFLRQLAVVSDRAAAAAEGRPLGVVDLGCGSAHLTLAAARWLGQRFGDVRVTGVDVRQDVLDSAASAAARAGVEVGFVRSAVAEAEVDHPVDLVLALHACDTATDEALARAVRWGAAAVLAAPCCHHDVQRQLKGAVAPAGFEPVLRQPILRERLGDVLTDALRASLLRQEGYRVDVVEFVDSRHTPRNALLRAVRTGAPPTPAQRAEHEALLAAWPVEPALARMLAGPRA